MLLVEVRQAVERGGHGVVKLVAVDARANAQRSKLHRGYQHRIHKAGSNVVRVKTAK